jgi:hypothetical protein
LLASVNNIIGLECKIIVAVSGARAPRLIEATRLILKIRIAAEKLARIDIKTLEEKENTHRVARDPCNAEEAVLW